MSTALVILAKAPRVGRVKTRLMPALGPQGACLVADKLLRHTVDTALRTSFEHLELSLDVLAPIGWLLQLEAVRVGRLTISKQVAGDLGDRMWHLVEERLQTHQKVLLMGSDAPAVSTTLLLQAAFCLDNTDAVFIPAHDGGYALIGLRKPIKMLFKAMPWSTASVMSESRARLRAQGCSWCELASVADIDEPADLSALPSALWP